LLSLQLPDKLVRKSEPNFRSANLVFGVQLPEMVVYNAEIEERLGLAEGWIEARTGIRSRRVHHGGVTELAVQASMNVIEKEGIDPATIDVVIMSTVTPDHLWPASACKVAHQIGASNAWAFDLSAACSGFLFSLETVRAMLLSGLYKRVLLINGDCMSSVIDPMDKNTSIIFGDGCAASIWDRERIAKMKYMKLGSNGADYDKIVVSNAGSAIRQSNAPALLMEGKATFKLAVQTMTNAIHDLLRENGLNLEDIAWVVPHQANQRIIDAITEQVGADPAIVLTNLDSVGNTTNASIPLCLAHHAEKFKSGDKIIVCAFGAGVTWGAGLIEV
jgi:3-oxoacyl-[acyl-carrier-protein] synthase-3